MVLQLTKWGSLEKWALHKEAPAWSLNHGVFREQGKSLTVTNDGQDGQVHLAFPGGALLQRNAITCSRKDVAASNGHELAAFVPAGHVVQYGRIVNKRIQFAERNKWVASFKPNRDDVKLI